MDEKTVENTLKKAIEADGGICWKLVAPEWMGSQTGSA